MIFRATARGIGRIARVPLRVPVMLAKNCDAMGFGWDTVPHDNGASCADARATLMNAMRDVGRRRILMGELVRVRQGVLIVKTLAEDEI